MTEYIFSKHAAEMMKERNISEDWVWRVLNESENTFTGEDDNLHFTKAIAAFMPAASTMSSTVRFGSLAAQRVK